MKIKRLWLSTKAGVIIPYISFEKAEIKEFIKDEPILVKKVNKKGAKLPESLEEALEEGIELARQTQVQTA